MRTLIFAFLALLAMPVLAQDGGHYDNARFGYGVDIPPGFEGNGESDNGDGQSFQQPGQAQGLTIWGGNLLGDLENEVASAIRSAEGEAWNITAQTVTPRWADLSAIKGFRVFHQRMVLLCDGQSYAAFRTEYSAADSAEMEPILNTLTRSLRGDCG